MKKKHIIAIIVAGIAVGSSTTVFALKNYDESIHSEDKNFSYEWTTPDYNINKNGETYGSSFNIQYEEDFPDLILAEGEHGVTGYIKKTDLIEPPPKSPDEAVKMMEEYKKNSKEPKRLNVYDKDGVTVIDTFVCLNDGNY